MLSALWPLLDQDTLDLFQVFGLLLGNSPLLLLQLLLGVVDPLLFQFFHISFHLGHFSIPFCELAFLTVLVHQFDFGDLFELDLRALFYYVFELALELGLGVLNLLLALSPNLVDFVLDVFLVVLELLFVEEVARIRLAVEVLEVLLLVLRLFSDV